MKSGRTTRIIDRCVQELFNHGQTFLYDERGDSKEVIDKTHRAFAIFKNRIETEHPNTKYFYKFVVESGIHCYLISLHNL